jgi:hypothetical protein|tara:strand:- start:78 stop:461 length:384 start_codon:yes stop_codon:yes gene_type:complete
MVYNQLFKIIPDNDILDEIIKMFGINNLDENVHFTNNDLIQLDTSTKLSNISEKLKKYYIPCKSKIYLNNINDKRAVTILKQFLKVNNYIIINKYSIINGERLKYYIINKQSEKVEIPKQKILISFN